MTMKSQRVAAFVAAAALTVPFLVGDTSAASAGWVKLNGGQKLPGAGGSEPGMAFLADGTLYVHATLGIPLHNPAWRLDPGATKFKLLSFTAPYNRLPGGGDADIAARGDDLFFMDLWAGSNSVTYSPDRGETWTQGTPLSTIPLSDRQWIAMGKETTNVLTGEAQNTVYALYQHIGAPPGLQLARSRDNGLTWDFHTGVETALGIGVSPPGHLISDGAAHLAIAGYTQGKQIVLQSFDEGVTWTHAAVTKHYSNVEDSIGPQMTAVGLNPSNTQELATAYVVKSGVPGNPAGKFELFVSNTRSSGKREDSDSNADNGGWEYRRVSLPGYTTYFPWIDYRGDKIATAWYQASKPGNFDPNTPPANNAWEVWYAESLDDGATWSAPERVDIAGQAKKGAICTKGLDCNADRELGDFLEILISPSGKSTISYVNANGSNGAVGVYVVQQQ